MDEGKGKDGRSLLTRTMSFRPPSLSLSARARALRDRFANSKRSLSDTWKDQSFLDETTSDSQDNYSPDNISSSIQSLIKPFKRNSSTPTSSNAALSFVNTDGKKDKKSNVATKKKKISPLPNPPPPPSDNVNILENKTTSTAAFSTNHNSSSFHTQRSRSLDSLNNSTFNCLGSNEPFEDIANATNNMDFPSPTLLDTPTLSPVHSSNLINIPFNFPASSTLDFSKSNKSSIVRPRPIKSSSYRHLSDTSNTLQQSELSNLSTSLPHNKLQAPLQPLPPPISYSRYDTYFKEEHTTALSNPIEALNIEIPSNNVNLAVSGSVLSASTIPLLLVPTVTNVDTKHVTGQCIHKQPPQCPHKQPLQCPHKKPPQCPHIKPPQCSHKRESQACASTSFSSKDANDFSGSVDPEEWRDIVSDKPLQSSTNRCTPPLHLFLQSDAKPKLNHQWSVDESRISCTRDRHRDSDGSTCSTQPLRPAEKRRRFFMRKQTNSAPDSFDGPSGTSKSKEHHSVSFCLGSVLRSRNSDSQPQNLSPPAIRLVRSRDGSREGGGTHYMNLPSPNVQTEGNHEDVFKTHHEHCPSLYDDDPSRRESCITPPPIPGRRRRTGDLEMEEVATTPPASALVRRRALVPPKLMADPSDDGEEAEGGDRKMSAGSDGITPRARRSSIVVIPPMQICPGDLLVYSKVLTQRNNLLDGGNSRKGKTTWSLLKLFDRSNRGKSESMCGLEEVLNVLQRSEFNDEQLSKYRGMCWGDFVIHNDTERDGKCSSRKRTDSSSSSSNNSATSTPERPRSPITAIQPAPPTPTPPQQQQQTQSEARSIVKPMPEKPTGLDRRLRIGLMRTQSEKSFERRLTGAMWRGLDKALPERVLPLRPSPLIPTLSEKDLLGSKEALASPVSTISRNECKRREALWDLFQSECAFLYDHLMVLKNVFMEPLKNIQVEGFAMFAEPELLFGNLDELCCVTYAFCKEFINLILQNVAAGGEMNTAEILVKLFQKSSKADSVSQAYHCYALNYINALNYLETLRRHIEFCEFEKWCNRDPRCKKLQLTDLLVAPVQHIMKVPLILKEVENRTEDPEERELIARILGMEENSLRELDDKMKWLKNFERLLEIQRNIVWPSILESDPKMFVPEFLKPALARQPCDRIIVSPRRQIIMEGPLNLWDSGKANEMYVVLFDDMLLISRRKKGLSKKFVVNVQKSSLTENWPSSCGRGGGGDTAMRYVVYKQPLSLDRFFIHDVSVPEGNSCRLDAAFVLVSLNRFQQIVTVHTFQAATDQLKQNWLLKLRDTQDKWKRTLQHTVFRSPRLSTCSSRKSTT